MTELVDATTADLDELQVPEGRMRSLLLELAALIDDQGGDAFEVLVARAGCVGMLNMIGDLYKVRSPLEEQRDYLRTRRELKELLGVDLPAIT